MMHFSVDHHPDVAMVGLLLYLIARHPFANDAQAVQRAPWPWCGTAHDQPPIDSPSTGPGHDLEGDPLYPGGTEVH